MYVDTGYNKSKMKFTKSTDGGSHFDPMQTIRSFTFQRNGDLVGYDIVNFPSLAVGPNVYLYLTYAEQVSQSNHNYKIKFTRSTTGGSSWDSLKTIGDVGNIWQVFPSITVDATGQISVAFLHAYLVSAVFYTDTYLTQSTDNGDTFSTPRRVSNTRSKPFYARWTSHYIAIASISALNEVFIP